MRLPNSAHEAHPWVIAKVAPDFELLDAWALPVQARRADVESFLEELLSFELADALSGLARALFAVRLRIGAWFGWDDNTKRRPIPGSSETSLRARLPEGLRDSANGPVITGALARVAGGFVPLYRTGDEWAAEISNATVHGVLHLGLVEQGHGTYRVQMGVYVKPRGRLGGIYMKLIEPFRHLIVYPALMRHIGRAWNARTTVSP